MILFSLFTALTHCRQIHIAKTMSASYHVSPNREITFMIDTPSVTFLLPKRGSITADVYKLGLNETYQFVGSLGPQIPSFGVYFPNKGKLILKSVKDTTASCYAIVSTRKCRRIYVSTYPNEIFSAVKHGYKSSSSKFSTSSNITIQNNQDVCFIHASNSYVKSKISYSTEETYDLLYLHNGFTEMEFTGDGTYENLGFNTTSFVWHSDPTTLSNFFTIQLLSNSTLPSYRVNFTNTLSTPLFITDSKESSNNQNPIYDHADADLLKLNREHNVVSLITLSIFAFIGTLIVVLGLLFVTNRIFRNQPDDDQMLRRDESIEGDFSNHSNNFTPDIDRSPPEGIDFRENEVIDISPVDYEA
ncbi:hypothetical protein M9Y10_013320 [Tritrichomonas musculus]|uniref:CUB-like domain-containing protein n=1 Tax=Tritrichomonas musculus TaxID=1915356 RepID=A0ABR2GN69_9EUKA